MTERIDLNHIDCTLFRSTGLSSSDLSFIEILYRKLLIVQFHPVTIIVILRSKSIPERKHKLFCSLGCNYRILIIDYSTSSFLSTNIFFTSKFDSVNICSVDSIDGTKSSTYPKSTIGNPRSRTISSCSCLNKPHSWIIVPVCHIVIRPVSSHYHKPLCSSPRTSLKIYLCYPLPGIESRYIKL